MQHVAGAVEGHAGVRPDLDRPGTIDLDRAPGVPAARRNDIAGPDDLIGVRNDRQLDAGRADIDRVARGDLAQQLTVGRHPCLGGHQ